MIAGVKEVLAVKSNGEWFQSVSNVTLSSLNSFEVMPEQFLRAANINNKGVNVTKVIATGCNACQLFVSKKGDLYRIVSNSDPYYWDKEVSYWVSSEISSSQIVEEFKALEPFKPMLTIGEGRSADDSECNGGLNEVDVEQLISENKALKLTSKDFEEAYTQSIVKISDLEDDIESRQKDIDYLKKELDRLYGLLRDKFRKKVADSAIEIKTLKEVISILS